MRAGSATLTATAFASGIGYTLTGPADSPLAGLTLIYGSNADATMNVNITQGIAAQSYNTANAATDPNTGTVTIEQASVQKQDTQLNTDISQVNLLVAQYQQQLLQQFAALEQAVSQVNTLLQGLTANSEAQQEAANIS